MISSVYGKDTNPIGFIERAVEEDRVLYLNKKMSQDLFYIPGLQLPDNLLNLDSNIIIRKSKWVVNTNPTTSSDIRFSLKSAFEKLGKYSESDTVSIEKNSNFTIAKSYADIKNFIDNIHNFNMDKSLFLGRISDYYARMILNETGIEVKDKSIVLNSSNLKHIFKNHGNMEKESLFGQIAISKDNIENVIETLLSPDSVETSDLNEQIGILFKKNIGGRITAITILSEKKKALTLKSAWIIKNKQHISPTTDEKSPVFTSETGWSMNAVSNNSIRDLLKKCQP